MRIAVTMSRFPKLTETFVLNDVLGLRAHGFDVEVFPLLRQRETVVHEAAARAADRAHYLPFLSPAIAVSNLQMLLRRPRRYVGAVARLVAETWRSPNFFVGGLGILPKVVHAATVMERLGVDHLHCHFATHPALAGWLVHRLVGIPYSFTAHGSDLHVDRRMLVTKVSEAAFVTTVSAYNRDLIIAECGGRFADKVHIVRCGVDLDLFAPRPYRPVPERPNLICIGTLHEVKGQRHLLGACARLAERGALGRCTLVGDGPDRAALERLAQTLGIGDAVRFAGARSREEVASLLAEADLLVAPSVPTKAGKREGIPVVLIEGMASGLPVVASRLSGIPELVVDGATGLLVDPGDDAGIADAVLRLRDEAGLGATLVGGALDHVRQDFELHVNLRRLAKLLAPDAVTVPEGPS
jgi:colanic acid/amylovoran biosynthesis glycosyltransferase